MAHTQQKKKESIILAITTITARNDHTGWFIRQAKHVDKHVGCGCEVSMQ